MTTFKQFLSEMGYRRGVVRNAKGAFNRIVEDLIWDQLKKQKIKKEDTGIFIWNGKSPSDRSLRIHIYVSDHVWGREKYDIDTFLTFFPKLFYKLLTPYFKGLRLDREDTTIVTKGEMTGDASTRHEPFRVDIVFMFDEINLDAIDPDDQKKP